MTGNEALDKIKNIQYYKEEKNWITATSLQNTEVYKVLEKELNELTKYKRAFEILKSKEIFEFKDDNCLYLNAEDHNWWGDIIESSFVRLSDEEYELLEELLND